MPVRQLLRRLAGGDWSSVWESTCLSWRIVALQSMAQSWSLMERLSTRLCYCKYCWRWWSFRTPADRKIWLFLVFLIWKSIHLIVADTKSIWCAYWLKPRNLSADKMFVAYGGSLIICVFFFAPTNLHNFGFQNVFVFQGEWSYNVWSLHVRSIFGVCSELQFC